MADAQLRVAATTSRWVCLDVGETLIDESRVIDTWAEVLGVTRLTFAAVFGATLARGGQHREAFSHFIDVAQWPEAHSRFQSAYGAFRPSDLYADALPTLDALREHGYRVAIVANQPSQRTAELRALGVTAEVMAMSDELGVQKPDAAFFSRTLELLGGAAPGAVAYVGDRPDNDVAPAAAAGMRAVWLRRGPWGLIFAEAPGAALVVGSLAELVERVDELWPVDAAG